MLTVEKIGGTSMSALSDVIKNIILYKRTGNELYNRIFVVSAFSGVTNILLENKKTGEPGVYHLIAKQQEFEGPLNSLIAQLKEINKKYVPLGLDLTVADKFIEDHVRHAEGFLKHLTGILASGYVSNEGILQAAREILASIGETHSAFVFTNILQNMGVNATLVDLSGFYDHEPYTIDQRIRQAFKDIDFASTICIATGYTKGTEGIMREFDRGYSEVTFSKIAVAVNPVEAIIHKEYHLCSADPVLVGQDQCIPVGFTNYDVADQLADVGMEAIHPKASKPLEINNINLRIKNTFEPEHPGTLITREYISPERKVEVITGTNKLVMIDIYDPLMVGNVGTDLQIMQIFANHGVSYNFKATSANSISIVIWQKDFKQALTDELESTFEKITVEKVAMVCLIGSNMDKLGLLAQSSKALAEADINIVSAGFALRKVNIQFIVAREDFDNAVIALNKEMGK
ncbi:aspartate kinase [Mucilaginibacter sp. Bleaf8]|uniref:aspartate kinase n=1 Tax=Mucilaginibacter sp. Bleaf8 TaxID=2834430 RepID=UPI001BCD7D9D|nr:aspartate kinase [Mucilaginibacter sp. Bleaf8]MBS7565245.1 aspartate kinase [Mucilaginibacter sp. Bleaf8]